MPKKNFIHYEALYVIRRVKNKRHQSIDDELSFNGIKRYIESCPAYTDQNSLIKIEEDAIYFGHGLTEIIASFPLLQFKIMNRIFKSFSEDNIRSYGHKSLDAKLSPNDEVIELKQEKLIAEARDFFDNFQKSPIKVLKKTVQAKNSKQLLTALLNAHNELVIGEIHSHRSSKKILIDNMGLIKKKGVDAIYLEHVFNESQKELFDAYWASDSLTMPIMLQNYLTRLDYNFHLKNNEAFNPYSFLGLVIQAKRYGIKIIPIDTITSYSTGSRIALDSKKDGGDRCLMMNYVAAKRFDENKEHHKKSIFFVGSCHINAVNSGIPGIGEIIQCPTLVIEDEPAKTSNKKVVEEHIAQPDYLIYMDTILSNEAKSLAANYQASIDKKFEPSISSTSSSVKELSKTISSEPKKIYRTSGFLFGACSVAATLSGLGLIVAAIAFTAGIASIILATAGLGLLGLSAVGFFKAYKSSQGSKNNDFLGCVNTP